MSAKEKKVNITLDFDSDDVLTITSSTETVTSNHDSNVKRISLHFKINFKTDNSASRESNNFELVDVEEAAPIDADEGGWLELDDKPKKKRRVEDRKRNITDFAVPVSDYSSSDCEIDYVKTLF